MKRAILSLVAVLAVGIALYIFAMYPNERFEISFPWRQKG